MNGQYIFNIRNNWVSEKNFWNGAMGKDSYFWTDAMMKKFRPSFYETLPNFFINFDEILYQFDSLNICMARTWEETQIRGLFELVKDIDDENYS